VSYYYAGKFHHHHIKPDYLGHFPDQRIGRSRFSVTEFDTSSEPRQMKRFTTARATPLLKLVAYAATIENGLLDKYFGIRDCTVEFVFCSSQRRDNVLDLALETLHDTDIAKRFVFGAAPPCPTTDRHALRQSNGVTAEVRWWHDKSRAVELRGFAPSMTGTNLFEP